MGKEKEQTFEFQSEVKQLLDILVYSLYKNKEVFLRELVSNAADALNKMQFEFLTVPDLEGKDQELKITDRRRQEAQQAGGRGQRRGHDPRGAGAEHRHHRPLGHPGLSEEGRRADAAKKQVDLIGKFGVGFYSSFMVAKEIHIITRSWQKDGKAWLWKSTGESSYTIEETEKEGRGTRIELLLKKDEKEFLETYRLKSIILKHSKFVPFPIYLDGEKIERQDAIWTQPKSKLDEKDYVEFLQIPGKHPGGAGNLAAPVLRRPGAVHRAALRSQDLVRAAGADERPSPESTCIPRRSSSRKAPRRSCPSTCASSRASSIPRRSR